MANEVKTFLTLASKTANGSATGIDCLTYCRGSLLVRVTNISGTTPTLDVIVESSQDDSNYVEILRFDRVTELGSQWRHIQGFGRYVRVSWVLGGTSPNFTFEVKGTMKEA